MSAPASVIWAPFDWDAVAEGTLGWIWTTVPRAFDWQVRTARPDWHFLERGVDGVALTGAADTVDGGWILSHDDPDDRAAIAGCPFIECSRPACIPGEDDCGMIVVHLPGGARMTLTHTTPDGAEAIRKAVLSMMATDRGAPDPLTEAIEGARARR